MALEASFSAEDERGNWTRYFDEESGKYYFYNSVTESTVWTEPSEFTEFIGQTPSPSNSYDDNYDIESKYQLDSEILPHQYSTQSQRSHLDFNIETENSYASEEGLFDDGCPWIEIRSPGKPVYWIHSSTDETVSTIPDELVQWRKSRPTNQNINASLSPPPTTDVGFSLDTNILPPQGFLGRKHSIDNDAHVLNHKKLKTSKPDSSTLESLRAMVKNLESVLSAPDAVMEPRVYDNVWKYANASMRVIEHEESSIGSREAQIAAANRGMSLLVMGYKGYAQYAALTADWLGLIRDKKGTKFDLNLDDKVSTKGGILESSCDKDDNPNSILLDIVENALYDAFDMSRADALLENRTDAARLERTLMPALLRSPNARGTAVRLYNKHRDSALLRHVLRQLSKAGHHEEISASIEIADIFEVYSKTLQYTLAQVPTASSVELSTNLLPRLKKLCCSTDYMFAFSQEVLRDLEERTYVSAADDALEINRKNLSKLSAYKFRRLRQEMNEWAMKRGKAIGGDSVMKLGGIGVPSEGLVRDKWSAAREAVWSIMNYSTKRHLPAIPGDMVILLAQSYRLDEFMEVLYKGENDKNLWSGVKESIPEIKLIQNASLLQELIDCAFFTSRRSPNPEVRKAACAVLAYACTYQCKDNVNASMQTGHALWNACELCASDLRLVQQNIDQLRVMVKTHPVVSTAMLTWARSQVGMPSLTNTALYITMAPLFIGIASIALDSHPLQRQTCLQLFREMLRVVRRDEKGGVEAMIKIKKSVLDMMVELVYKGYVVDTIINFTNELEGQSRLDLSLVRYFVSEVLRIALPRPEPPAYSLVFVASMKRLLDHPRVEAAVLFSHFDMHAQASLAKFIKYCIADKSFTNQDKLPVLLKTLKNS